MIEQDCIILYALGAQDIRLHKNYVTCNNMYICNLTSTRSAKDEEKFIIL